MSGLSSCTNGCVVRELFNRRATMRNNFERIFEW